MLYPFTAIVGQDEMKLALLLNAINPSIGGVLIEGEKGTAKSTAVRALPSLLPPMETGTDAMTVVELPINATEDRVVGSINLEKALQEGVKAFEPGILHAAHQNILYVDEVNLLDDHIVDILLDVAAMGVNTVEREGVSHSHPSRFILVGTMNPEEGDLRPQLLDRFGLSVMVYGEQDPAQRMEVIKRRLAFGDAPEAFIASYEESEQALHERLLQARKLLPTIIPSDDSLLKIASISIGVGVDGHRSDITMMHTARAHAAFHGRSQIVDDDIKVAARLTLKHRMRRLPFEEQGHDEDRIDTVVSAVIED
ncbi:MAG: AAA family ATPase [Veillonella sp.]|jgi:ATPase associated with various cellular activities AAA_5|uniref:ATP-binding protein n=1 Tax=Veillonella TaxID=29465 RepID=UPI001E058006|nr:MULTISPECIES: AAA family ATPase [Veillonella]MBS6962382.1 AAA family ATPase [Veillonella sp.]MDU1825852.1 AAA family ATPase [Veillonella sp.]MDU2040797.1 AAA family ATPase [Veillonella parvula]MDU3206618.1 AAA family ATPase [Veillonella parvula]MDU6636298.1 AAA family ATPase [Veillonella parvula]